MTSQLANTVFMTHLKDSALSINKEINNDMGHLPTVGTVERTSPMCSLYNIVVLPAASKPSITTLKKVITLLVTNSDNH